MMSADGMKFSPKSHYQQAETLLIQGENVASKIRMLNDSRSDMSPDNRRWQYITQQMDEYGKQCMGIWTQALAHATLATVEVDR